LYNPDPKSAWTVFVEPIVVTHAEELVETVSWSTGVFQMLSAGSTEHLPIVGPCADAAERPSSKNEITDPVTGRERSIWHLVPVIAYRYC
jgi:hypothetical protein